MQMVIETTVDDGAPVTETLSFSYDASGTPMNVIYNGTAYFYTVNLQGDVMAILDENGNCVVEYSYDAWGNILSVAGTMADTLGESNPLTYRSYVYDYETSFYYLQSRYYDPEVGRFINADVMISTGQGLLGNNMFAYCNNNPVSLADPSGTACCALFDDNQILHLIIRDYSSCGGNSYASGGVSTRGSSISIKEYLNTNDPEVVLENLEKDNIAYYNDVFVIKTPFDASFSFGFIGLSKQQQNADVLRHEYGHTVQLGNMGVGSYITNVTLPSITINLLDRKGNLLYDYYSYPWEAEANELGGSALSQSWLPPLPQGGYTSYWDLIKLFF